MSGMDDEARRVRFYGVHDLAVGWHAPRVVELATRFVPSDPILNVLDALELHNVEKYLSHELFPQSCSNKERHALLAIAPEMRSSVARFFSSIDNSNFASVTASVDREYHRDFLDLLGRNGAFERCDGAIVLPALSAAGVHLGDMLASKILVRSYDEKLRDMLLASPQFAELILRKYLEKDAEAEMHIPTSLTPIDARGLLERYVNDDDSNLNYIRLISTSNDHSRAGIDAKLRLQAKRRTEELAARLFENADCFKVGCEVSISDDQEEPVVSDIVSTDGSVLRYVYGRRWLEETADNPGVLNNFLHTFEFADHQLILTFPAYPSQFSVMERIIGLAGKYEYKTGAVFQAIYARSQLDTLMYSGFLESRGINLEQVISWFFETYIVESFGIKYFSFAPSAPDVSYLQRVRHLFAEMESVAGQFNLFVENGELERDLLTMGSDQVRYKEIPSLLEGKYLYESENEEISGVLHLLFSDQSTLNYIDEGLRADNAVTLLLGNVVAYGDFREHQRSAVDHLVELGVLDDTGTRVRPASMDQLKILAKLFNTQAVSYYHLSSNGRAEAKKMVEKGWVKHCSSLLTNSEAEYFNYFLNRVGFSNGPNLRNRYLHGTQAGHESDGVHFNAYLNALRLTLALVIKINDDLCLAESEGYLFTKGARSQPEPEWPTATSAARVAWEYWE